jgi:hypothetical protein
VSNPAKFALSYLLIDVYLASHFPQLFIRYDPGPPDLHDISQASVYKRLKLSLNFTCNQPGLASVQQYDFTYALKSFTSVPLFILCASHIFLSLVKAPLAFWILISRYRRCTTINIFREVGTLRIETASFEISETIKRKFYLTAVRIEILRDGGINIYVNSMANVTIL